MAIEDCLIEGIKHLDIIPHTHPNNIIINSNIILEALKICCSNIDISHPPTLFTLHLYLDKHIILFKTNYDSEHYIEYETTNSTYYSPPKEHSFNMETCVKIVNTLENFNTTVVEITPTTAIFYSNKQMKIILKINTAPSDAIYPPKENSNSLLVQVDTNKLIILLNTIKIVETTPPVVQLILDQEQILIKSPSLDIFIPIFVNPGDFKNDGGDIMIKNINGILEILKHTTTPYIQLQIHKDLPFLIKNEHFKYYSAPI